MKKIIFILMFFTSCVFADYEFIVDTTEEVDSYFNVFNSLAMILGHSDYETILKLCFLVGGFFAMTTKIIIGEGQSAVKEYIKFSLMGVALLSIVFSQKDTIWVKTNSLPSYCSDSSPTTGVAIANVPQILAFSFTSINKIGRGLTQIADTAFTPPNNFGHTGLSQNSGYIGALKKNLDILQTDLSNFEKIDTTGKIDTTNKTPTVRLLQTLISECISVPFSGKGIEGMNELDSIKNSSDYALYLSDLYGSNRTVGGIPAGGYTASVYGEEWSCGSLYQFLKPQLDKLKDNAVCGYDNKITGGAISLFYGSSLPEVPVNDMKQISLQAGLINMVAGVNSKLGINVAGGSSSLAYSMGKTKADYVQQNIGNGLFMAQMLPLIQITIRTILYGFFPFLFIVVLLRGGTKILGSYLETLIWVELWSPTAAILNGVIMTQASSKIGAMYDKAGGLTASSSFDILSTGSQMAGVAGYLYLSVPALTWLIIKGSAVMLGNITSGLSGIMSKNLTTETLSKDREDMRSLEEVRSMSGKDLSMAEALSSKADFSAIHQASDLFTNMKHNDNGVRNKALYEKESPFASLSEKQRVSEMFSGSGSIDSVIGQEAKATGNSFSKTIGSNDTTTSSISYNSGVSGVLTGDKANSDILNKFGSSAVASNAFNKLNEGTIKDSTRFERIARDTGNSDKYFSQSAEKNFRADEYSKFKEGLTGGEHFYGKEQMNNLVGNKEYSAQRGYVSEAQQRKNDYANAENLSKSDVNGFADSFNKNKEITGNSGLAAAMTMSNFNNQNSRETLKEGITTQTNMPNHIDPFKTQGENKAVDSIAKSAGMESKAQFLQKALVPELERIPSIANNLSSGQRVDLADSLASKGVYSSTLSKAILHDQIQDIEKTIGSQVSGVLSSNLSEGEKASELERIAESRHSQVKGAMLTTVEKGFATLDNEGNLHYKDTANELREAQGFDRQSVAHSTFETLNGQKGSFISLTGRDNTVSLSSTGSRVTDTSKAEKGFTNTGSVAYDSTYLAIEKGYEAENLAVAQSLVSDIKNVVDMAQTGKTVGKNLFGK